MTGLIGIGVLLLPFGLRIWYVERSLKRNGVRVVARCIDRVYEGNSVDPKRVLCEYFADDGSRMRWIVSGEPDFPEVGDRVELIYDAHYPSQAERWMEKRFPITLGVGWTSLAGLLIAAGTLGALLT
ncbi:hypothetical protein ACH4HG_41395 [Streptomyces coeruleorubidus]|uniref:hypothetical protein n=1 Tax=Streptomyces coeruleorubidus TaxID=116188 RepID=UPI001875F259|nr:hypothetical protein [Streptomyces bellus]GGU46318.1 hypothetical protein GCM10010244_85190 [Streptomyces bellus]